MDYLALFFLGAFVEFVVARLYRASKHRVATPEPTRPISAGQFLVNVGVNKYPNDRPKVVGLDGVDRDIVVIMEIYASATMRTSKPYEKV